MRRPVLALGSLAAAAVAVVGCGSSSPRAATTPGPHPIAGRGPSSTATARASVAAPRVVPKVVVVPPAGAAPSTSGPPGPVTGAPPVTTAAALPATAVTATPAGGAQSLPGATAQASGAGLLITVEGRVEDLSSDVVGPHLSGSEQFSLTIEGVVLDAGLDASFASGPVARVTSATSVGAGGERATVVTALLRTPETSQATIVGEGDEIDVSFS